MKKHGKKNDNNEKKRKMNFTRSEMNRNQTLSSDQNLRVMQPENTYSAHSLSLFARTQ